MAILLGLAGRAEAQSYTYVAPGFTQELIGTAPVFLGGVTFAPDGDPWVSECERPNSGRMFRFDLQTRYDRPVPYDIHPYDEYNSGAGCGLVRHPDGYIYTSTIPGTLSAILPNGIVQLNAETGLRTGRVLGGDAVGNTLGITIDPLTGHLVYAGYECRSPRAGNVGPTCYIYDVDPSVGGTPRVYAAIAASQVLYLDGMEFDPTGNYLFMATRAPSNRLTILDRNGGLVQNVPLQPLLPGATESPGPDGVAFHEDGFVVTNNLDGTITRYDFPNGDYAQPPVQSLFASGGFRGDLSQVGPDGCLYVTQEDTRYPDGLTTENDSLVRFCRGFIPPVGIRPGCHSNADCGGETPVCRLNGQCGECSASDASRCTGATSVCDVVTGTCRGCASGTPAGTSCDDRNPCTTGDRCSAAGACSGTAVAADDGNPCTVDACDPVTGVTHTVDVGAGCSDVNVCTLGDRCQADGRCAGTLVAVDDGNPCTVDACDPVLGVIHAPAVGVACNDGNACTAGDVCDAAGACGGTAVAVDDGNPCTADACDPVTGVSHTVTVGAACNDGDACTAGDTCQLDGSCGGAEVSVEDGNPCTLDACDPLTGPSHTPAVGTTCNDGNACTTGDACTFFGACAGAEVAVDDGNACTADACDPATGPRHTVTSGAACDDGDTCTIGDRCQADGRCGGAVLGREGNLCAALDLVVTASLDATCGNADDRDLQTVLAGTPVYYCYQVTNRSDVSISGVSVTDSLANVIQLAAGSATVGPGQSATFISAVTYPAASVTDVGQAHGTAPNDVPVASNLDSAAVQIVAPTLALAVTVSTTGSCPGQEVVNVLAGTGITWCYTVTNTGALSVSGIEVSDDVYASSVGSVTLAPGQSYTFSRPATATGDVTLIGLAAGVAAQNGVTVPVESNYDPAAVNVVSPGIRLDVTVSTTGTCPGVDALTVTAGTSVTYCYQVTNGGDTTLDEVVLTLGDGQTVDLGSLPPGGSISYSSGPAPANAANIETAGVAGIDPYDNPVSSSDSAVVNVTRPPTGLSGATRTIGYYSTHPQAVAACLVRSNDVIDLGWLPLRNERYDNEIDATWAGNGADRDGRVETAMSLAMGILKANVARWTNGKKRSALEKARMQASQQVLAAICNSATATPPFSLGSAVQTLAGTNVQAILNLNAQADAFNNSGDNIPLGADYGSADSQYPWDDPSDPND